jgi:hypothetical protein
MFDECSLEEPEIVDFKSISQRELTYNYGGYDTYHRDAEFRFQRSFHSLASILKLPTGSFPPMPGPERSTRGRDNVTSPDA